MAERYGETPDSAVATELFGAERALLGARRSLDRGQLAARSNLTDRTGVSSPQRGGAPGPTLNADGQMSASTQTSHSEGDGRSQTWRPCSISRSESTPRSSGATMPFEVELDLHRVGLVGELQQRAQPGDVRVDRQAGQVEPHRPHDVAGLAADARQRDEVVELGRHLAAEALLERLRHADEVLRLRAEEPGRLDRSSRRRRGRRAARSAGVGYFANSAGVTMLTRSSVRLRRQDRRRRAAGTRCRASSAHRDVGILGPKAPRRPRRRAPGHHVGGP